MISWRMAAAWVAALVAATVLTWQIVGLADSQVGESPAAVTPTVGSTTTGDSSAPTSTDATAASTSTSFDSTTTTVPEGSSSSSSSTPPSTESTTSISSSSTTTSIVSEEWSVRTVNTVGGTVVIRYRADEVELQAATPLPGFSVEVDDPGPPRVRVEFENDNLDIRVEARMESGSLDLSIDEDD